MALLQPLTDLAEICHAHGVRHVVISPGSRSAALTLAFARHEGFQKHVVMDERSAGFIALGMAQQLNAPVVLICTSGSAAYNYAPAVAEAFFQQIPLLILTADRPQEWIHQLDGQTIYQTEIYGKHVKRSFTIPADYAHKDSRWMINRTANEAALLAKAKPCGPVHINVPIREPFYPASEEVIQISDAVRIVQKIDSDAVLTLGSWQALQAEWSNFSRILIAGGQHRYSHKLSNSLAEISERLGIPVLGDCITNLKGSEDFINSQDLFLSATNADQLRPDLLITFGLSFVSKSLKQFLQQNPAVIHWHISEDTHLVDTFYSVTRQLVISPDYFFENILNEFDNEIFTIKEQRDSLSSYKADWTAINLRSVTLAALYLNNLTMLSDLTAVNFVLSALPQDSQLHVGNSMPIRYVNALGSKASHVEIFANRGTSGIDGSVSTAIGAAIITSKPVFLLVGDVAFLYDRNGLLIQPLPANLKIIILNNAGGNIFRMIDGPAGLPELENYFETRHSFTARRTAKESKITYFESSDLLSLKSKLTEFLSSDQVSLLEIFTDPAENTKAWKGLKHFVYEEL